MPSQHKHPPISLRLPEADRAWVLDQRKNTGQPVNAIIAGIVAAARRAAAGGITAPSVKPAGATTRKPAAKKPAPAKCAHRFVLKGWCKDCREYVGQK